MRKFLSHDSESGELRLVYADLWNGQHERTEYRVMSHRVDGSHVRGRADLDGTPVKGTVPDLYIDGAGPDGSWLRVWTETYPVVPTVKSSCPRASNARRKCALCAAEHVA